MARRDTRKRRHSLIPTGDLSTLVDVLKPVSSTTAAGLVRTLVSQFQVYMKEETAAGTVKRDGVNIEDVPTHKFTMRWRRDMIADRVLSRGGERFRILNLENLDGRKEFIELRCRELGSDTKEATKA